MIANTFFDSFQIRVYRKNETSTFEVINVITKELLYVSFTKRDLYYLGQIEAAPGYYKINSNCNYEITSWSNPISIECNNLKSNYFECLVSYTDESFGYYRHYNILRHITSSHEILNIESKYNNANTNK